MSIGCGAGNWRSDLPRKGWYLESVYELEEADEECAWCGTAIRFVYVLTHEDAPDPYGAGCICAEHLTEDYIGVRKRASEYARKRSALLRQGWKAYKNRAGRIYGYYHLGHRITVLLSADGWNVSLSGRRLEKAYPNIRAAKIAGLKDRCAL